MSLAGNLKEEILARALNQKINYIHFTDFNPVLGKQFNLWEKLINDLLKVKDLFVTVEFEPKYCRDIIEMGFNKKKNFVPFYYLIFLMHMNLMTILTFKVTDKWFAGSNAGMWSAPLKNVFKKSYLTSWSKYLDRQEIL